MINILVDSHKGTLTLSVIYCEEGVFVIHSNISLEPEFDSHLPYPFLDSFHFISDVAGG